MCSTPSPSQRLNSENQRRGEGLTLMVHGELIQPAIFSNGFFSLTLQEGGLLKLLNPNFKKKLLWYFGSTPLPMRKKRVKLVPK